MVWLNGWGYLILAGLCEVLYASIIPRTDGFTRLWPSLYCGVFLALSIYLLSLSVRDLPLGRAYSLLSFSYALVYLLAASLPVFHESFTLSKTLGVALVILGVLTINSRRTPSSRNSA